ncbi:MAG TPA: FkbM family methyltransferase [Micropepsaceae bacterium]|nr:FkbM family methyltransferase [Micropepsaceae bacterium]
MSLISRPPFRYRLASLLARRGLQPLWQRLNDLSYWGLGYNNWISQLNGEDRFAAGWAQTHKGRPVIVFDIGANEGDFTGVLLPSLPQAEFHLFEPNPPTFARLKSRYGEHSRIHLNACGVGDKPGKAILYDFKSGKGSERASLIAETFSTILHHDSSNLHAAEVPVATLDDYCRDRGIGHIHFLKIDTEGFERFVLEGASECLQQGRVDIIQLEMNEQNVISAFSLHALTQMLPDYDIYRILPGSLAAMVTRNAPYQARFDVPKYANLVLARRGASAPEP